MKNVPAADEHENSGDDQQHTDQRRNQSIDEEDERATGQGRGGDGGHGDSAPAQGVVEDPAGAVEQIAAGGFGQPKEPEVDQQQGGDGGASTDGADPGDDRIAGREG